VSEITVKTNNVPRDVVYSWELSADERREFDYLDWDKLEAGEDSREFFRYRGEVYDLGEFSTTQMLPAFNPLREWDGYLSDSFFSGVLVRYCENFERVVVATFYA
jgi:hypothetical protein